MITDSVTGLPVLDTLLPPMASFPVAPSPSVAPLKEQGLVPGVPQGDPVASQPHTCDGADRQGRHGTCRTLSYMIILRRVAAVR